MLYILDCVYTRPAVPHCVHQYTACTSWGNCGSQRIEVFTIRAPPTESGVAADMDSGTIVLNAGKARVSRAWWSDMTRSMRIVWHQRQSILIMCRRFQPPDWTTATDAFSTASPTAPEPPSSTINTPTLHGSPRDIPCRVISRQSASIVQFNSLKGTGVNVNK